MPMIELIHTKSCLVFGCGNTLFGDDGFGPEVVSDLENHHALPDHAACLDVGTSIRDFLFDILLAPGKPEQLIVVDAGDCRDKRPGDVFEIDIDEMNPKKTSDFSLHQFPTTNMLKELKTHTDMDVRILVGQIETIPDIVSPGLSPPMAAAVSKASRRILKMIAKEAA
jgi:coenzyme F420 hydrogenase subunit delta